MWCRVGFLSTIAVVAGCTTAPNQDDVVSFGTATSSAVSVIGETAKLENDLAVAYTVETNACRYLQSRKYDIAPIRAGHPESHLQEQVAFLKALSSYADALSKVTSPEAISKLKTAANQLTTSATKLVSAASVASPPAAVVAPVFKFGADTAVLVGEARRMQEVREIAATVHPLLFDATSIILNEDEEDREILSKRLNAWETAARCSLDRARGSGNSAYGQFIALDKAKRDFRAREEVANRRVTAIAKVQAAHAVLAEGSRNLRAATDDINMFLDDIAALKAAIGK